jgi:hypothetical protein
LSSCDVISPHLGARRTAVEYQNEVTNEKCQQFSQNENFNAMHNHAIGASIALRRWPNSRKNAKQPSD